ncbi:hypothetical protein JHK85_043306 [Glycine max]|nr:hypothetical protein JHK85_043306 [Glycine max]
MAPFSIIITLLQGPLALACLLKTTVLPCFLTLAHALSPTQTAEKEEVDEHAFFTEPCGVMKSFSASSMDDSWQLTPLTMSSSSSSSKQRSSFGLSSDYSCLQLQSHSKQQQQEHHQDQGCYMFGAGQVVKEEPQKTVHRFFDEWPHKGREGSWLDLDDKSSTTQLSISIPTSSHDFSTFSSRTHHDG